MPDHKHYKMPLPDFNIFLRAVLEIVGDGNIHTSADLREDVKKKLRITEEQLREMLGSGKQSRFQSRVHWAIAFLRHAGLTELAGRGRHRITDRGRLVLRDDLDELNQKYLQQFPEFQRFMGRKEGGRSRPEPRIQSIQDVLELPPAFSLSPEEFFDHTYKELRKQLIEEVLDALRRCSPRYFEQIVLDVLVAMGYGGSHAEAGETTRYSADGGIDGVIKQDKLGLDSIYLQAKRWEATVGRPTVQAFAGSLEGFRARKGVLITTSQFSSDAREYVDRIINFPPIYKGRVRVGSSMASNSPNS